ncbi:MAG: hypothetical protein L0Y72_20480 [Gemmataceae bacterium]|nr:hypothetical protein [Gemmataceae bacterium]MCI0741416.1 hypothetical protein [Gemmataceae bacterium]
MSRTKAVSFGELARFLSELGFHEKRTTTAQVLEHPKEGMLVFRLYKSDERVDEGDLVSTRKFLDYRGVLAARDFDAFLHRATTPA